jgi:hypothetical protein
MMAFYVVSVQFPSSSINCQASFIGISHTCTSTNKHHLKNSQKQQQKKRRFWGGNGEGGGCFKNVSRQLHAGGYNHVIHVTRQNKGEKMQTLGVQKGGIVN